MKEVTYTIDLNDPKSAIKVVRDDLVRLLNDVGAQNVVLGWKKVRFYDYCLEHSDGSRIFERYIHAKRKANGDEEEGFKAAEWKDQLS